MANGWDNTDGENENNSWNCGAEGDTQDPDILTLRDRMVKNAVTVLLASHGTPMLLAGDEFGNTQFGNNNPYCQDNEISWLNWDLLTEYEDRFEFFRQMIKIRKEHPALREVLPQSKVGPAGTSLHGSQPFEFQAHDDAHMMGILYGGHNEKKGMDDILYLAINTYWEEIEVALPALPKICAWRVLVDTGAELGKQIGEEVSGLHLDCDTLHLQPRSVMLLEAI